MHRFRDRRDAGRRLGAKLGDYAADKPWVIGLPRGGVVVAAEIARALDAPLDIWIVRKVGVPWHPELGLGAVAEGGQLVLSHELVRTIGLSDEELMQTIRDKRQEVEERVRVLRGGRTRPALGGATIIVVDDGIATGGSMRAALQSLRAERPKRIVLAVPVAAPDSLAELSPLVDHVVCPVKPRNLRAVGDWYEDFTQVSDQEVLALLERERARTRDTPLHA